MPALGFIAIGRFLIRVGALMWRKEEIRGLLFLTLVTILTGTWFYYQYEPTITTWGDAYYFTVITLTSIGYGDLSPTLPLTKFFTTIYVFVGLGIIAGFIGLVGTTIVEDASQRREARNTKKQDADE